jgi:hypothetical protein
MKFKEAREKKSKKVNNAEEKDPVEQHAKKNNPN